MGEPNLVAITHQPVAEVVEILQDLLAKAESGDLFAIAIAAQMREGWTASAYYVGDGDVSHLHTAIERVQLRLLMNGEDD